MSFLFVITPFLSPLLLLPQVVCLTYYYPGIGNGCDMITSFLLSTFVLVVSYPVKRPKRNIHDLIALARSFKIIF